MHATIVSRLFFFTTCLFGKCPAFFPSFDTLSGKIMGAMRNYHALPKVDCRHRVWNGGLMIANITSMRVRVTTARTLNVRIVFGRSIEGFADTVLLERLAVRLQLQDGCLVLLRLLRELVRPRLQTGGLLILPRLELLGSTAVLFQSQLVPPQHDPVVIQLGPGNLSTRCDKVAGNIDDPMTVLRTRVAGYADCPSEAGGPNADPRPTGDDFYKT